MASEPVIAGSARKHGILRDDMIHAFNNAVDAYDIGDGFIMLVGPARNAQMLEIGYVTSIDAHVIVHAMKARAKFLR